jgi:hypothetical protein
MEDLNAAKGTMNKYFDFLVSRGPKVSDVLREEAIYAE